MTNLSPRPFFRNRNELRFYLTLEEWPTDVPLPPQTAIVGIGENNQTLVPPYREFDLEPTRTVETFGGWFRFPIKIAEARQWYLTELSKYGWVVASEVGLNPSVKIYFDFVHPAKNLKLDLSLQWYESHNETWAIVTRYAIHPYALPEEANGEPAAEQIALPIAEMAEA
mgnify:CR=1 FL=1